MPRLSDIALAPMPPAPTDTLVGVRGGNIDAQWTASQVAQIIPTLATSNLNFYVATTGSDSNNTGTTLASPFATIQHAVNVAARYDYQNAFFPIINVADGTYHTTMVISLPGLLNLGGNAALIGDAATPANCTVFGRFSLQGSTSNWAIKGFNIDIFNNAHISISNGASLFIADSMTFSDSGNSGTDVPFFLSAYAGLTWQGQGNITLNAPKFFNFCQMFDFSLLDFEFGQINFPNPCAFTGGFGSGFLQASADCSFRFRNMGFTNFATVTGTKVVLSRDVIMDTDNGKFSDIPGNVAGGGDATVEWINAGNSPLVSNEFANSNAGIPTTSQLDSGMYAVYKDTSGGGVYLVYNDAGTIKKVALT